MLQKYPKEIVSQVLAASDVIELVRSSVELKHAGSGRYKGLCPFHNEKTPSFTVSQDRQQFHCFGCGKHGDAITFLSEMEGLSFSEALRKLADRAGIRLPALSERDGKEDYLREQLVEFDKMARVFFQEMLANPVKGSPARHYLEKRALQPETVKKFGLGYAPDGWDNLLEKARASKFKDSVLEASGLFRRSESGRLYDFFRNRLMIPIRDVSGNTVAFGGRDLGDGTPKYINSPENMLYKKSRILYGLYENRDGIRQERRVLLVEGYFDLMRCVDAGINFAVASCGTALTGEQANLIRRYAHEVVVVFDADAAGIKAALRGIGILVNAGLTVRALTIPDGKDPDDYIRMHGRENFLHLVDESLDFVTFYVRMNREQTDTIEGRTTIAREVFALLRDVSDTLRQGEYLKRLATELGLHPWKCEEEYRKFLSQNSGQTPTLSARRAETDASKNPLSRDDCNFVGVLLKEDRHLKRVQEAVAGILLPDTPLGEVLRALLSDSDVAVSQRLNSDAARRLYAAAANNEDIPADKAVEIVTKRINQLKKDALRQESDVIQRQVNEAERRNDRSLLAELLGKKMALDKQRASIGAV